MAFCNSCGADLQAGAKFCAKCGTVAPFAPVATPPTSPAAAASGGSSAVKVILIAVAAIAVLGVLGMAAATFIGLRIARHSKVETSGGKVRVESPFGTVETTKNPEDVAKDLGIDIYPGARALHDGAASVNVGGTRTVAANFECDDSLEKVAEFYKSKFPQARVSVSEETGYSIVSMEKKNIVTIHIERQDGKTLIHIANVTGNAVVDDSKD